MLDNFFKLKNSKKKGSFLPVLLNSLTGGPGPCGQLGVEGSRMVSTHIPAPLAPSCEAKCAAYEMPAFAEACGPLAENVINIGGFPDYGLLYGYTNLIKLQSALIANLKNISIRANYQEEGNVLPEPNFNRYFKYILKGFHKKRGNLLIR